MVMGVGHVFGTDGREWYNFWSGVGADIGGFAFIGAAFGLYRKHNCHVGGCWRIAKQQVVGTSWVVLLPHLGALALTTAVCLVLTTRVFRWE